MNRILTKTRLLTAALLFGALPLLPLAPDLRAQSASSAAVKEIHVAITADKISVESAYVIPRKDVTELKKLLSALAPKANALTSARRQWTSASQSAQKLKKDPPPTDKVDKALTDFDAVNQKVTEFLGKGNYATIEVAGGAHKAKAKDPIAAKEPKAETPKADAKGAKAAAGKESPDAAKKGKAGNAAKEPAADTESADSAKASGENMAPQDSYLYYTWSKAEEKKSSTRSETTRTEGIAVVKVAQKLVLRGTGEPAISWFVESEVTEVEKTKPAGKEKPSGKEKTQNKGKKGK